MTIEESQKEIFEEFSVFEDWMDKYSTLIELGKDLPEMSNAQKTQENLIRGCQSQVWLHAELTEGKVIFHADSDAILTKGMIALLLRVFSGREPDEILSANIWFIDKIGLSQHLSPTRANGLLSMMKQINLYALAFKTKMNA
jgi:cysteine desulfuration protein SufE